MNPTIAHLKTLGTAIGLWLYVSNLIGVRAFAHVFVRSVFSKPARNKPHRAVCMAHWKAGSSISALRIRARWKPLGFTQNRVAPLHPV
jgi:hypothetical protein